MGKIALKDFVAMTEKMVQDQTTSVVRSDVKVGTFQSKVQRLQFNNRECKVYSFYDVSKVAEVEELKATNKMYVTMNSTVAHEMLTPLRCISEMVERIDDPSLDSSKKADFCSTIKYTS